jgi:hypothetical protein
MKKQLKLTEYFLIAVAVLTDTTGAIPQSKQFGDLSIQFASISQNNRPRLCGERSEIG